MGDRSDKGAPRKLDSFRLTSASRDVLETAAALYGGVVEEWKGAPSPPQYELYTETNLIPVLVPPGQMISQWMEMWSGGGCKRRCDGVTETITDQPCLCPDDLEERQKLSTTGKACHIMTRLSLMLPDCADFGTWRIEGKGYYFATEIGGTMALLEKATAQGVILPAQLRLEQRQVKRGGATMKYAVPVLELPGTTTRQLLSGLGMIPETESAAPQALPAPQAALPSPAPTPAKNGPNLADPATIAKLRTASAPAPTTAAIPEPVKSIAEQAMAVVAEIGWTIDQGREWLKQHPELKKNEDRLAALKALLAEQQSVTAAADTFFGSDGEEYSPPAGEE